MKFALIQMHVKSNKDDNLSAAQNLIRLVVASEQPDWILLPELFEFAGGAREDKLAQAETFPEGAAYRLCQNLAADLKVFIHAGSMMEKIVGQEQIYNTSVVFDRSGQEVARYRKIHLTVLLRT